MNKVVLVVAVVAGCATGGDRLAGDATGDAPTDAHGDAKLDAAPDACIPHAETCNNLDDDCDGKIDEDFTTKGMACTAGTMGACVAMGHFVCDPNGGSVKCDAVAGTPMPELCDGIDNDCDGKVDEDFPLGVACDGPDADLCTEGVFACNGTGGVMCTDNTGDNVELCNAIDDDCDGKIDEGFSVGAACDGPDTDLCKEGTIACAADGTAFCTDATGNNVELCNGFDDDCNGVVDDGFPVGQPCTMGLGACARTSTFVCNTAETGVTCPATPGTPAPDTCGDGVDSNCDGVNETCPTNDRPAGATDISAGGTFTVDLSTAHDDNAGGCGGTGGRDVFYKLALAADEVVYLDTFGSDFDTVLRVYAGSCTSLGTQLACVDESCSTHQSQYVAQLAAGSYCVVVDQSANDDTATSNGPGHAVLHVVRGNRTGTLIATASGSVSGDTSAAGKTDQSTPEAACEQNSHQPDDGYYFTTCPAQSLTVGASTCGGTVDTIIYLRSGSSKSSSVACDDDGCGGGKFQSTFSGATITGPNLHWLIVDGFGVGTGGRGPYTLTYTIQ